MHAVAHSSIGSVGTWRRARELCLHQVWDPRFYHRYLRVAGCFGEGLAGRRGCEDGRRGCVCMGWGVGGGSR